MEDRLARVLGSWGSARRVDERERTRLRTAVLLTPEVDALWWDQFNQQMARISARAQRPPSRVPGGDVARVGWGVAG